MTEEFAERLEREKQLYLQEMRDGCIDCSLLGPELEDGYCDRHDRIAHYDIDANPRKYVKIGRGPKKVGDGRAEHDGHQPGG